MYCPKVRMYELYAHAFLALVELIYLYFNQGRKTGATGVHDERKRNVTLCNKNIIIIMKTVDKREREREILLMYYICTGIISITCINNMQRFIGALTQPLTASLNK